MSEPVQLANFSSRIRVGCKGPAAGEWLTAQGVGVPSGTNRFCVDEPGLFCARLATSEFLVEALSAEASATLVPVRRTLEWAEAPAGVWPVLRQDCVIGIDGPLAHDLFAQTCAIDMVPVERQSVAAGGPVIMTSMAGVSIVLACLPERRGERFTVWSDPSYSHYFWNQLLLIAGDLGGGADPARQNRTGGSHP